jgi:hypothetical protein
MDPPTQSESNSTAAGRAKEPGVVGINSSVSCLHDRPANPTFDAKVKAGIATAAPGAPVTGAPIGVGLVNTQDLATKLGLTAIPANQPGGTDYAISGVASPTASFS